MMNPYYEHFRAVVGEGAGSDDDGDDIGDIYRSVMYQRGYGLGHNEIDFTRTHGLGFGETFASLMSFAKPLLTKGLQYFGKQAVNTAANIAQDAIAGENIGQSAKRHLVDTAEDIFARAPGAIMENVFNSRGPSRKRASRPSAGELVASSRRRLYNKKRRMTGAGLLKEYPALERIA